MKEPADGRRAEGDTGRLARRQDLPQLRGHQLGTDRNPGALRAFLEADGHVSNWEGKIRCLNPDHLDSHPSCHVYDDNRGGHAVCYACGERFDAYEYLTRFHGLTPREALTLLEPGCTRQLTRKLRPIKSPRRDVRECSTTPLPERVRNAHEARVARNVRVPAALTGRGFCLDDLTELGIVQENDAAVLAIVGAEGQLLRLKRRRAPDERGPRYRYLDADGSGTPAWCSRDFGHAALTLVIEGELNGMAAWLARPDIDVVGVAGTPGSLPLSALAGRAVVVYTDDDPAGQDAKQRWTGALQQVGCTVSILPPWNDGDACDVAGALGRQGLAERLA